MEHNEAEHQLFMDFKKAYNSVTREVLCNILTEVVSHETGKDNKYVSEWNLLQSPGRQTFESHVSY